MRPNNNKLSSVKERNDGWVAAKNVQNGEASFWLQIRWQILNQKPGFII